MVKPLAVSGAGGPWDVIYTVGGSSMGFITDRPASVRQISQFAVSIRTGGEAAYSQDTYQQHIFNGFNEGGDRLIFETGDKRYQWSDGQVALGRDDAITLASAWENSDAAQVATAREILDFNPTTAPQPWIVYAAGTTLRAFNTTTLVWADAHPAAGVFAAPIKHIWYYGAGLVISFGSALGFYTWDGATLTTNFFATGAFSDVFINGSFGGVLYWRSLGANIYSYIAAWSAAIPVGLPHTNISGLLDTQGLLFIAKPEGLYTYDGTTVRRLLSSDTTQALNNFRGLAEWLGALYLPWLNALHKGVVSSSISITNTDITPTMKGDTAKERYGHGLPIKAIAGPRRLFVAFDDGEGVYPEVLSYDGLGFQQVYRGTSGDTMKALGYSRTMDWLLLNDGATRIKRLINNGDNEYPNFATSGEFWTPALDGGYPTELKAYRSIAITTENCLTAMEYVRVYYRLDGGAWVLAGTIDTNGILQEIILDTTNGHVVGKKIEFKITLTRTTGVTSTPKIKLPMIVRMLVLPGPIDAYREVIVLKDSTRLRNGYGVLLDDGYTIQQRVDFLLDARSSPYPITRQDEFGRFSTLKITDMSQDPVRKGTKQSKDEKGTVSLSLYDLSPGLVRQLDTQNITITQAFSSVDFLWTDFMAFGVGAIGLATCDG